MKILKICGVVAGIHALVLLVIFVNPGCSSTSKADATAADTPPTPPAVVPVASTTAPAGGAAATETSSSPAIVPVPAPAGNAFYSPTRPNTPAATALEPTAPVTDVTPAATYVVKSGDSMWLIAHRNKIKVAELAAANGLKATATLHSGQKLILPSKAVVPASAPAPTAAEVPAAANASGAAPAPASGAATTAETKYVVKPGEALSTIAKRFNLHTGDLAARNNITDPRKIRPGQELIIPAGHTTTKAGKKTKKGSAAAATPAAAEPTAAAPTPSAPDAGAPALDATPTVSVPIIKIDGADSASPSAAAPAK